MDGLRFLCFLSVFFFHSFHTEHDSIKTSGAYHFIKKGLFGDGNIGVNFFFVLSGFLITYLLIEEKKLNGRINLGYFWTRRILRIWPLFYFCVFFGFCIFPFLKTLFGQVPNETASIGYYLVFLNNFDFIYKGAPDASILGVLWSVAIEEQFYLVWPVILALLPVRHYWIAFVLIIASSLVFRTLCQSAVMYENHTLSCIGDMAVGASGAWLIIQRPAFRLRMTHLGKPAIAAIYLVFAACFFLRTRIVDQNILVVNILERLFIAVVVLFVILEQNYARNSFFKMSRYKTMSKLGRISYGLYCLHFIGILIVTTLTRKLGINTHFWQVMVLETGLALGLTILISSISYRYYERPFLKIKERFAFITK